MNPPAFLSPTNTQACRHECGKRSRSPILAWRRIPNTPALPLTFALASGPTNMIVTPGGLYLLDADAGAGPHHERPVHQYDCVVSVSNGDFVRHQYVHDHCPWHQYPAPHCRIQPSQVVTVPNGTLVVTNTGTNPNLPNYPLVYILLNPPSPLGAAIDPNGIITWAPTLADVGLSFVITTVVTDTNPCGGQRHVLERHQFVHRVR